MYCSHYMIFEPKAILNLKEEENEDIKCLEVDSLNSTLLSKRYTD